MKIIGQSLGINVKSAYLWFILKDTEMTNQETYNLANELTKQEVNNVISGWDNTGEEESIRLFNSLVQLGDSKEIACATVLAKKFNGKEESEIYYKAYCI